MERRTCLYTRRLTQRQKKWQDGFLFLNRSSGKVHIKSENGVSATEPKRVCLTHRVLHDGAYVRSLNDVEVVNGVSDFRFP